MPTPFTDRTYLWIVWHRGKKPSDVSAVLGLYANRGEALHQAQTADADGLTPIKDVVLANVLKCLSPDLVERPLRGVVTAAK